MQTERCYCSVDYDFHLCCARQNLSLHLGLLAVSENMAFPGMGPSVVFQEWKLKFAGKSEVLLHFQISIRTRFATYQSFIPINSQLINPEIPTHLFFFQLWGKPIQPPSLHTICVYYFLAILLYVFLLQKQYHGKISFEDFYCKIGTVVILSCYHQGKQYADIYNCGEALFCSLI